MARDELYFFLLKKSGGMTLYVCYELDLSSDYQGAGASVGGLDESYVTANDSTATQQQSLLDFDLPEQPSTPSYALPSDTESEAETETVVNVQSFSKDELFQKFRAVERNAVKYKNKYKQVYLRMFAYL